MARGSCQRIDGWRLEKKERVLVDPNGFTESRRGVVARLIRGDQCCQEEGGSCVGTVSVGSRESIVASDSAPRDGWVLPKVDSDSGLTWQVRGQSTLSPGLW
ncbi:hypothetical protein AMTR_s00106p00060390 [Amborella trichopoda]|uniref:Uncharacterized protein n=1 Tax=Amborella trichopoda TaxID=13333 RepID=W1NYH6_AMBTC|nr:hypothetical protein AMTR_s00106p00060390 [Amborella trichopoda]